MSTSGIELGRYDLALRRGALLNFLGGVAKLLHPLSLILVTRLWGPAVTGQYVLGQALMEILSAGVTAGYADGVTIFASRHADAAAADASERAALYRVFANAAALTVALSGLLTLAALLFAPALVGAVFPQYAALLPGLCLLAAGLIPSVISALAIASTKVALHMEHDAFLNGFLRPFCSLCGFVLTYSLGGGLSALFAVQLGVECLICMLAVRAFTRYFSLSLLGRALRQFQFDRELLHFAIPQSLNLTFNRYIARLDGIMLALLGLGQVELGYFATAGVLTGNLGQIRTLFSGAIAPVLARHHARGERAAFEAGMSRVSRWATALVVPAIALVAVLHADILRTISPAYGENGAFVPVLLIPAYTNCAFGMAGACLMFTGHSRVTLVNSLVVALLNTLLTWLLIPRLGMLGAAIATAVATTLMTGLQMIELWTLERVHIRWRAVWKPHLGMLAVLIALWCVGPTASLDPLRRGLLALAVLALHGALMLALRLEELTPSERSVSP